MDAIKMQFLSSIMDGEKPEIKLEVFALAMLLGVNGVDINNPETVRALEIIHSYAAFIAGMEKK